MMAVACVRGGILPRLAEKKCQIALEGKARSNPLATERGSSFFLEVSRVRAAGSEWETSERVLVETDGPFERERIFTGERVALKGRVFIERSAEGWLLVRRASARVKCQAEEVRNEGGCALLPRLVHASRSKLSSAYRKLFPERLAGFLQAVTLGRLDGMDRLDLADLRAAGLAHIVAVSGLHVGSASLLVLAVLAAAGAPRKARFALPLLVALAVIGLADFRPSALRAGLMGAYLFAGRAVGRDYDPLTGLSMAGVVILATNPLALFDRGFQMSFSAALGILVSLRMSEGKGRGRACVAVCAGAQLGIAPYLLTGNEGVPVAALGANLLVVPIIAPMLLSAIAAAAVSGLFPPAARALSIMPGALAKFTMGVAQAFSRLPAARLSGGIAGFIALFLYLASLYWIVKGPLGPRSFFRPLVALLCAVLLVLTPVAFGLNRGRDRITVLSIGQGDSILLQDRSGRAALVDGGPDGRVTVAKLRERNITGIDLVICTHPHYDHYSGLLEVLSVFKVGRLLIGEKESKCGRALAALLEVARRRKVPVEQAREGNVVEVSDRMRFEVLLAPGVDALTAEDPNPESLVLMAELGRGRMLLTGDIEGEGQQDLLSHHPDLKCDVLKVPHQGAEGAVSGELLRACRPKLAAISVGRNNPFGHPRHECLHMLGRYGIEIYRTDRDGDIELTFDDGRITVGTRGR